MVSSFALSIMSWHAVFISGSSPIYSFLTVTSLSWEGGLGAPCPGNCFYTALSLPRGSDQTWRASRQEGAGGSDGRGMSRPNWRMPHPLPCNLPRERAAATIMAPIPGFPTNKNPQSLGGWRERQNGWMEVSGDFCPLPPFSAGTQLSYQHMY